MSVRTASNLKKNPNTAIIRPVTIIAVTDRENHDSQDVVIATTSENESFKKDIWICENGVRGNYCNSSKAQLNVEEIKESIMVGIGMSMMATKIGSLKCQVIKIEGSI
jgi:hypothetical protein